MLLRVHERRRLAAKAGAKLPSPAAQSEWLAAEGSQPHAMMPPGAQPHARARTPITTHAPHSDQIYVDLHRSLPAHARSLLVLSRT